MMLAFAEGKKIERFDYHCYKWIAVDGASWDWESCRYRIAPEPWTGKIWVHPDGGITAADDEGWKPKDPQWRLITAKEVGDD